MRRKIILSSAVLLAVIMASGASAQMIGLDWIPTGSGARALGMGGAFTAIADDATAAWWNPAGLAQLERPEVSIVGQHRSSEGSVVKQGETYTGTKDTTAINFASFVMPFGGSSQGARKAVSISYGTFMDFDQYRKAPSGNYRENDGSFNNAALTFATELSPRLSVGIGANYIFGTMDENDVGPSNYFREHLKAMGYNIAAGILWRAENWNLGFMARSKTRLRMDSSGEDSGTGPFHDIWILRYPIILSGGVAYKPTENFTLSLDLQYLNLSEVNLGDGNSVDIYQPRIGIEYLIITKGENVIPIRLGAYSNPNGARDFATGSKVEGLGYTAGTGLVFKDFQVDFAYVHATTDEYVVDSGGDVVKEATVDRILLSAIYRF